MGGILQQMADLLGESISQSEYIMLKTYYENSNKLPAPLAAIEQGDESADNLKVNLAWVNLLDGVQTKLTNQVLFKLATTSRAGIMSAKQVTDLTNAVTNIAALQTLTSSLKSSVTTLQSDMTSVKSTNTTQGTNISALQTLTSSLNASVTTLQSDMTSVKSTNTTQGTNISALQTAVKSNAFSGTINITSASAATTLKNAYNALEVNRMQFYIITDSNGLFLGDKVTAHADVAALFSKDALGASVGDLLVLGKYKMVVNVAVYRIIPLNDAKAADGSFPGADGLESVWDKTQVNKIPSLESKQGLLNRGNSFKYFTADNYNIDQCLDCGVYLYGRTGRSMPGNHSDEYYIVDVRTRFSISDNKFYIMQSVHSANYANRSFVRLIVTDSLTNYYGTYSDWVQVSKEQPNASASASGLMSASDFSLLRTHSTDISSLKTKTTSQETLITALTNRITALEHELHPIGCSFSPAIITFKANNLSYNGGYLANTGRMTIQCHFEDLPNNTVEGDENYLISDIELLDLTTDQGEINQIDTGQATYSNSNLTFEYFADEDKLTLVPQSFNFIATFNVKYDGVFKKVKFTIPATLTA
jgi:hypothetical protein